MISYLSGKIIEISGEYIVVVVGGIGYKVLISEGSDLWGSIKEGSDIELYTSQFFRETEQYLLGFKSVKERNFFELLTTVSGVGPKLGSQIIANIEIPKLARMIVDEDIAGISKAPGVGKKMSQRMILDLKDKMLPHVDGSVTTDDRVAEQNANKDLEFLNQALAKLGFSSNEIKDMTKDSEALLNQGKDVEEVLASILSNDR